MVIIEDLDWMGNGVVCGNLMVFVEGVFVGEICDIEVLFSKKKVINVRVINIYLLSDVR